MAFEFGESAAFRIGLVSAESQSVLDCAAKNQSGGTYSSESQDKNVDGRISSKGGEEVY